MPAQLGAAAQHAEVGERRMSWDACPRPQLTMTTLYSLPLKKKLSMVDRKAPMVGPVLHLVGLALRLYCAVSIATLGSAHTPSPSCW